MSADPLRRPSDFRRALAFVRPYRARLGVVLLASLAGSLLALAPPYFLKLLVDEALLAGDGRALAAVAGALLAASLLGFLVGAFASYRYVRVSAEALFDIRLAVFRHLQSLSPRFFAAARTGDLLARLNGDVSELQRIASDTLLSLATNLLVLVGTLSILVYLHAGLFLVSLATIPVAVWSLSRFRRPVEEKNRRVREKSAAIGSFLVESLLGLRHTVALGQEATEAARFREKNDRFVAALLDRQWTQSLAAGLPGIVLSTSTLVVLLAGGTLVIEGALSLGAFVAFAAYHARLLGPVQGLMALYLGLAAARAPLRRVFELLDTEPEVVEPPDPLRPRVVRGALAFEDVRLSYGREGFVLDGVRFRVEPGETVAIVGASGAGKSTIADLLIRRLDPDEGAVRLDGIDLRRWSLAELRARVAVVDQEPFLWSGSIEENVRYGKPDATPDELRAAIRRAGLEAWVDALPEGLATSVGERGRSLSAGERQRIAIARALVRDPQVLVLDEATSSLDGEAEARFVAALSGFLGERTTVILSHRLPLVACAERVLVLDGGRIVEEGTVGALLDREGVFRRLFGGAERRAETLR